MDESCISNPKYQIELPALRGSPVQLEVSDFGFEMQDSSNFEMLTPKVLVEPVDKDLKVQPHAPFHVSRIVCAVGAGKER